MKHFNDFTPIEVLDKALNVVASSIYSKKGILANEWIQELKKQYELELEPSELNKVMSKFIKDEYLICVEKDIPDYTNTGVIIGHHKEWRYLITWEGIVHKMSGGYNSPLIEKENINRLNEQQRKQGIILFRLNWIIAIGTGIAAIYYLLEILKFFRNDS